MQERQLRLGDIIDDYCPRERRLTNHAVVAMVGDEVKQTRCTTCDAEHPYKRAKVPVSRRRKEAGSEAYRAVLASVQKEGAAAAAAAAVRVVETPTGPADAAPPAIEATVPDAAMPLEDSAPDDAAAPPSEPARRLPAPPVAAPSRPTTRAPRPAVVSPRAPVAPAATAAASPQPPPAPVPSGPFPSSPAPTPPQTASVAGDRHAEPSEQPGGGPDEGRVHRRLIRAQLPRIEGKEPTPRPIPQFTIHDARAAAFRGRGHQRNAGGGNRPGQGGRNPFARETGGRGGFSQRPPKPGDANRRQRPGGRSHKPGKKHSK